MTKTEAGPIVHIRERLGSFDSTGTMGVRSGITADLETARREFGGSVRVSERSSDTSVSKDDILQIIKLAEQRRGDARLPKANPDIFHLLN